MGEKLLKYYKYAKEQGGLAVTIKLAQVTKIPSAKAAMEPDSPQNIQLFKNALQKITGKPSPNI